MIINAIFLLHILAALYAFTKRWQDANVREGFLGIIILGLAFTILWAITGQAARLISPEGGYASWFDRDTISLVLVGILDGIFFFFFFLKDKEKQAS